MRLTDTTMKRLSLYLFLIFFTLPTLSQADDIRDFQIEGMSIGDSLLDHFDKNYIEKNKIYYEQAKGNKEYARLIIENSLVYEDVMITFKDNKKFKIAAIEGFIYFINDLKSCLSKREEVIKKLSAMFKNQIKKDFGKAKHFADNRSYTYDYTVGFGSKTELSTTNYNAITISCYDWSKQLPYDDQFRISIRSKEIGIWLDSLNY